MTGPDLSPEEALLRDCLAADLLARRTPRQIRDWLAEARHPEAYREDMRRRLNTIREEHRQTLGEAETPATEEHHHGK